MGRTAAVYAFPALVIALGWLRLEETRADGADWLWITLLALAPALAPKLWLRLALVAPAALIAAWIALDTPAIDDRPGFFGPVLDRFWNGVGGFYDVAVPFSAVEHQRMHGVVLLAIFGFCVLLAQFIAARRPLPALLLVIGGAGWPAALYPSRSLAYGAVILAAALWVLAGIRTTRAVPALVAGAVLVVAAAGASSSAAVAKEGVLAWESWSPGGPSQPVGVSYVWEGTYGGIEFPKKRTTVLRITGPKQGLYWRARHSTSSPGPLAREPDARLDRARGRQAPQRPASARPLAEQANVGPPGRRGGRTPGRSHHRRRAAGLPPGADPRRCLPPLRRPHARLQRPAAWADLHGLQLRAAAGSGRAGDPRGRVPARARPLSRHRAHARRPLRRARSRPARRRPVHGRPLPRAWPYKSMWEEAQRLRAGRANAYGAVVSNRDLAPLDRWLHL